MTLLTPKVVAAAVTQGSTTPDDPIRNVLGIQGNVIGSYFNVNFQQLSDLSRLGLLPDELNYPFTQRYFDTLPVEVIVSYKGVTIVSGKSVITKNIHPETELKGNLSEIKYKPASQSAGVFAIQLNNMTVLQKGNTQLRDGQNLLVDLDQFKQDFLIRKEIQFKSFL